MFAVVLAALLAGSCAAVVASGALSPTRAFAASAAKATVGSSSSVLAAASSYAYIDSAFDGSSWAIDQKTGAATVKFTVHEKYDGGTAGSYTIAIYDEDKDLLYESDAITFNEERTNSFSLNLDTEGIYYVRCINAGGSSYDTKYYRFGVGYALLAASNVTLAYKTTAYTGSARRPGVTVKHDGKLLESGTDYTVTYKSNVAIGVATVTVTGKGYYSGSVSKTFTIRPATTAVSKLTGRAGAMTVTWKAKGTAGATGVQIRYAKNSAFKASATRTVASAKATSSTIEDLERNTRYYVKMRTYKVVGGKTYYSDWSAARSIVTK